MKEKNKELNNQVNELHTVLKKSQADLMKKIESNVEDDKYEKEIETLKNLCQKIMDLYQLSKKEIEKIVKKQKKLEKEGEENSREQLKILQKDLEKKNQEQFAQFEKQFEELTVKVILN